MAVLSGKLSDSRIGLWWVDRGYPVAVNRNRVERIVQSQSEKIEQRCGGYSDMIFGLVVELLQLEDKHRVSAFDVQKPLEEKVSDVAASLLGATEASGAGHETA